MGKVVRRAGNQNQGKLEEISKIEDPDRLWQFLENAIEKSSKIHGKMKKTSIHSRPYWTKELTDLRDKMKEARGRYNRRNTDINKELMIEAKEIFDNERKQACQDFIINATKSMNASEASEFWKKFNAMFRNTTDKGVDPLVDENLGIITENSEIEEKLFETFFQSKHLQEADLDEDFYQEIINEYDEIKKEKMQDPKIEGDSHNQINAPITIKEIKAAIKK